LPVDIFDHVTSLARASRSRASKNWRGGATSLVCHESHDGYPRVVAAPAFRRSVGGTALISTLPKKPVFTAVLCYNVGLLPVKCISVVVTVCPVHCPFIVFECRGFR